MNTVLFSFGNQKGGVGKSTLTALFASYIHYKTDFSIAVVDADDMQSTLKKWRATDLKNGLKEEDTYDLFKIASKEFPNLYKTKINGNYDFVALDMPGNLKQEGVITSLIPVNLVISPMNLTQADIDATKAFLQEYEKVDEHRVKKGADPAEKRLILSKLDRRTGAAKNLDSFKQASKWPILESVFAYRPSAFGTNVRTFMDGSWEAELDPMCSEIFELLKKLHGEMN